MSVQRLSLATVGTIFMSSTDEARKAGRGGRRGGVLLALQCAVCATVLASSSETPPLTHVNRRARMRLLMRHACNEGIKYRPRC